MIRLPFFLLHFLHGPLPVTLPVPRERAALRPALWRLQLTILPVLFERQTFLFFFAMVPFLLRFLRVRGLHFFRQAAWAFFLLFPFFLEVVEAHTTLQSQPLPTVKRCGWPSPVT